MEWRKPVEKKPDEVEVEKITLKGPEKKSVTCLYCGAVNPASLEWCPACKTKGPAQN